MKQWQKSLPFLISAGLLAWLVWRVSPTTLFDAARQLQWELLVPATVVMVFAVYLWDCVCLRVVYSVGQTPLRYCEMLRVRGLSYLIGALHCQLGQAMVVWNVARFQNTSLVSTASRGILLLYHDAAVLMTIGLTGALFSSSPMAARIAALCGSILIVLICLGAIPVMLSHSQRERFQRSRWGAWLGVWSWRHSAQLVLLRAVYYAILVLYLAGALQICRVYETSSTVLSTAPLVLAADSLPSISGLGTRETALYLLLGPENRETLIAMGLFWSTGIIVTRLGIGVTNLWVWRGVLLPRPVTDAISGQ